MENALDYGKKINVTFSDFDKYIIDAIEILKEFKKNWNNLERNYWNNVKWYKK